ncbi:MAG: archease [Methanobacteriaceae archaeon]|nr:archease [Methanobacteriaceae archaeon]
MLENDFKAFEYFDVTADIGFFAYGDSLEDAYSNAACAMFNVMTDIGTVKTTEKRKFKVESEDYVSLLYDFLEELLFLFDVELLFFSKFEIVIDNLDDDLYELNCVAYGEEVDWEVHPRKSEVKAITFHKMDVIKQDNGYFKLSAILDL